MQVFITETHNPRAGPLLDPTPNVLYPALAAG